MGTEHDLRWKSSLEIRPRPVNESPGCYGPPNSFTGRRRGDSGDEDAGWGLAPEQLHLPAKPAGVGGSREVGHRGFFP